METIVEQSDDEDESEEEEPAEETEFNANTSFFSGCSGKTVE